jgi:hypothetical protein
VLGADCVSELDCPGGFCGDRGCTRTCETDADCTGGAVRVCGVGADGRRSCVPECGTGYACVDGVSTSCSVAPETYCTECGCPEMLRCEDGVGCQARVAVGEPCRGDTDCESEHCGGLSTGAGVCRVPVGASCDTTNCDYCLVSEAGWTYCSRQCSDHSLCPGGYCTSADPELLPFTCHPSCTGEDDTSCPGAQCTFAPNFDFGTGYVCHCEFYFTCELHQP